MTATAACRKTNLERANAVRLARAEVKRQLGAGKLSLAQALADRSVQTASIGEMLRAQRFWGDVRCETALAQVGIGRAIASTRCVQDLTEREKTILLAICAEGRLTATTARRLQLCRWVQEHPGFTTAEITEGSDLYAGVYAVVVCHGDLKVLAAPDAQKRIRVTRRGHPARWYGGDVVL